MCTYSAMLKWKSSTVFVPQLYVSTGKANVICHQYVDSSLNDLLVSKLKPSSKNSYPNGSWIPKDQLSPK